MSTTIEGWVLPEDSDPVSPNFPDTFGWAPLCTRCGAQIEAEHMALHDQFHKDLGR